MFIGQWGFDETQLEVNLHHPLPINGSLVVYDEKMNNIAQDVIDEIAEQTEKSCGATPYRKILHSKEPLSSKAIVETVGDAVLLQVVSDKERSTLERAAETANSIAIPSFTIILTDDAQHSEIPEPCRAIPYIKTTIDDLRDILLDIAGFCCIPHLDVGLDFADIDGALENAAAGHLLCLDVKADEAHFRTAREVLQQAVAIFVLFPRLELLGFDDMSNILEHIEDVAQPHCTILWSIRHHLSNGAVHIYCFEKSPVEKKAKKLQHPICESDEDFDKLLEEIAEIFNRRNKENSE